MRLMAVEDDRLAVLRSLEYAEYLTTPEWQETRGVALREAGYRCDDCRSRQHLDVHHLTYERLGCERLEDLQVLCRDCHEDRHADLDPKRYADFQRQAPEDWRRVTSKAEAKSVLRAIGMPSAVVIKTMPSAERLDPEAVNRFRKANGLWKEGNGGRRSADE